MGRKDQLLANMHTLSQADCLIQQSDLALSLRTQCPMLKMFMQVPIFASEPFHQRPYTHISSLLSNGWEPVLIAAVQSMTR